jgi:hypothetical protein
MDAIDKLRALADTIEQAEQRLPEFEQEAREFRDKVYEPPTPNATP